MLLTVTATSIAAVVAGCAGQAVGSVAQPPHETADAAVSPDVEQTPADHPVGTVANPPDKK